MAKKSDEKDVLIVRDEKTGEISVVAGLNADGSPKRTPARLDNAKDFLLLTCSTTFSKTSSGNARNPAASVSTA